MLTPGWFDLVLAWVTILYVFLMVVSRLPDKSAETPTLAVEVWLTCFDSLPSTQSRAPQTTGWLIDYWQKNGQTYGKSGKMAKLNGSRTNQCLPEKNPGTPTPSRPVRNACRAPRYESHRC